MNSPEQQFCLNAECPDYRKIGAGNIAFRGKYGKNHQKNLLYCRTCGQRFAATQNTIFFGSHLSPEKVHQIIHHMSKGTSARATARLVGISKGTVNKIMAKIIDQSSLESVITSLQLTETEFDALVAVIKKRQFAGKKKLSKDGAIRQDIMTEDGLK
jgi:hypothetical protein